MNEYSVDFVCTPDGTFTVDIHQPGSSGTSRYQHFTRWEQLQEFFRHLVGSDEMLNQLQDIGHHLKPGTAYHRQMFLPDASITDVDRNEAA